MKHKWSIGLMTGTVNDGFIDVAALKTDGHKIIEYGPFELIPYEDKNIQSKIIKTFKAAQKWQFENMEPSIFAETEKLISLEQSVAVNKFIHKFNIKREDISCIGFHGLTVLHQAPLGNMEGKTKQLGDGNLLSSLTKKTVIYNFRQNDLKNDGHGAPLTPIFHKLLKKKFKLKNIRFINIGGIVNITKISDNENISGTDIGPGMCLIDRWIRQNTKKNYDENGMIAQSGKVNKIALNQLLENFYKKEKFLRKGVIQSFDTKYFDFSFVKDLSLEDGTATLTEFTAQIIIAALKSLGNNEEKIILCGGGRKNNFLINKLKKINNGIQLIDEHGVDGDFVESQAFAYLAVRSYLNLPISFPETTGVKKPCSGGIIIKY